MRSRLRESALCESAPAGPQQKVECERMTVTRLPLPNMEPAQETGFVFPGASESPLDLRRILGVLKRRKVMILGVMFVVTSLATLVVSQQTPLYRAEAKLVVEKSRQRIAPIEAVVQGLNPDYLTNETEAA